VFLTTIRGIHSTCFSESIVTERLVLPQKEAVLIENKIVQHKIKRYLSVGFRGNDMASSRLIEAAKRQMGQKLPMGTPDTSRCVSLILLQLFHIGNRKLSVLSNPFVSTARELFPCMHGEYTRMRVNRTNAQRDVLRNGEESNRISGYALRMFHKLKFAIGGLILIDRDTQSSRRKDLDLGSNPRQCPTTFRIIERIGRERNSSLKDAAPPAPRDSTAKRCELKLPARRISNSTSHNNGKIAEVPSKRCSSTAFFLLPLLRRVPALSARMEIRSHVTARNVSSDYRLLVVSLVSGLHLSTHVRRGNKGSQRRERLLSEPPSSPTSRPSFLVSRREFARIVFAYTRVASWYPGRAGSGFAHNVTVPRSAFVIRRDRCS
ncbi:hypothetical protein ALC53_02104, partial [Atta colombica]